MFRLRQEHLDSFDRVAWERFVNAARAELRRHYPAKFGHATDVELESFIRQQQMRAEEYELESEFALLNYLHVVAMIGPDFAERPEYEMIVKELDGDEDDENIRAESALAMALQIKATPTEVTHV